MPDVAAALGRRYGPLPGYAWVGVAGVGTFVIVRHRRKNAGASTSSGSSGSSSTAAADPTTAEPAAYSGPGPDGYGGPPGIDPGAGAGVPSAGASTTGAGDFGSVPLGGSDAFVNGDTGTATPGDMAAVGDSGPTPSTVQPVARPHPARPAPHKAAKKSAARRPAPAKRTGTVTRGARAVTVHRGDTLSAIARREKVSLSSLEKANRQIRNPNLIHPGEKINVPRPAPAPAPHREAPKPAAKPAPKPAAKKKRR